MISHNFPTFYQPENKQKSKQHLFSIQLLIFSQTFNNKRTTFYIPVAQNFLFYVLLITKKPLTILYKRILLVLVKKQLYLYVGYTFSNSKSATQHVVECKNHFNLVKWCNFWIFLLFCPKPLDNFAAVPSTPLYYQSEICSDDVLLIFWLASKLW